MTIKRLTWRRQENETGLAKICQTPRGLVGKVDGKDVFRVSPKFVGFSRVIDGWWWIHTAPNMAVRSFDTMPLFDTKEAARDSATAYYKALPQ